jgi:hypothetical protein
VLGLQFLDRINRIYMIVFPACASHADRHPVDLLVLIFDLTLDPNFAKWVSRCQRKPYEGIGAYDGE